MKFKKNKPVADRNTPAVAITPVRPGISETVLKAAGIRRVTSVEAQEHIGFSEAGVLLPYLNYEGQPLSFNDRPFYRLRVDDPEAKAKYLSPAGSGCQAYFPPGFSNLLVEGGTMYLVEGEFKALSLCEAGIPAVAVGGITSTCPKNADGVPELLPALVRVIQEKKIKEVVFIGDNDTAFIPAFSKEMVKLAGCLPVPLKLLRIPVDASGKAPDDLIAILGADFSATWQKYHEKLEAVKPWDSASALAWKLLSREAEAIEASAGERRTYFQEALVKLGAGFTEDVLVYANIADIAKKIGLSKSVFSKAVKAKRTRQRDQQLEGQIQEVIEAGDPNQRIYYDGDNYYRWIDAAWRKVSRPDAQLHLSMQGLSKVGTGGDSSPVDQALYALQQQNRVDHVGKLCGRPAGYWVENGIRLLVTDSPRFIEGVAGDFPTIRKLLANLFGANADHAHGETQLALLLGWLKLARNAMRHPDEHSPGQVLALVGPPDCGKSLIIEHLISPSLGGRAEDATAYFLDRTEFNGNLWGAELLVIGDKGLGDSAKDRGILRDNLKKTVGEGSQEMRFMYAERKTLRPIWRIVLAANNSAENITDLPMLDASFGDKIIYLKCFMPSEPLFPADVPGEREAFTRRLRDELPRFLHSVDNFDIPAELVKARFGITEWHHPEILDALEASSHLQPIVEVIHGWIQSVFQPDEKSKTLSSFELFEALTKKHDGKMPAHVCNGVAHLGRQLASLSESPNWKGLVTKGERRIGKNNQRQTVWTITKPEGEGFEHTGPANIFAEFIPKKTAGTSPSAGGARSEAA